MDEKQVETLAKFAGFTYDKLTCDCSLCIAHHWIEPNAQPLSDNFTPHVVLPNFPHDLNACFRWVIPEIEKRYNFHVVRKVLQKWICALENYSKAAEVLCGIILELIEED